MRLINNAKPLRRPIYFVLLSLAGYMVLNCGCKTGPPGAPSDSLAAVVIEQRAPLEVARTVSQVFQDAGYLPAPLPANQGMKLHFEKEGSTGDTVVYGDWSSSVWYRVKVNIRSLNADSQIVECDAFRLLGRGDPRFEEETRLWSTKKKPYQELLNKVKAQLNP